MLELADAEPARRPALALMLDNYANALTKVGQHTAALEASEQALTYYRQARETNPGLDSDVARVLSNYSQRLAVAGRFTDAAAAGTEAIGLCQQLSSSDHTKRVDEVITLANVAAYTAQAGNPMGAASLALDAVMKGEQLAASGAMSPEQLATLHVQATKATGGNTGLAVRYAERAVDVFRQAGLSDTAAYATALRNLAALHGMQGQIRPGLAAIDEAVAVFTQLLEVDSSHRVELASALGTRAQLLLEDRRNLAGRDTAIAAVEHYRRIPQLGFDNIDQCGKALATLAVALRDLGEGLEALDEQVQQCLQQLDNAQRAHLLGTVVNGLPLGHPRAPGWIHQAINDLGSQEPMLRLSLGGLARRLRSANPGEFDRLWRQAAGDAVPAWAMIDAQSIEWVKRWVASGDYTAAEDFLRQHPHLLGEDYHSAVEEVFIAVEPARVLALRDIRARLATSTGAQANTGAMLDLADTFLAADLRQRVGLLNQHGDQLRDDFVGRYLRGRNDSPRARASVSLIELSRIGLHTDVLAAAADDNLAESVLTRIAEQHDAKVLRQASVVLMDNAQEATEPQVGVVASFFLAVGMIASEFATQGRELLPLVREAAPERVAAWKRLCQCLAPTRPEFAQAATLLEEAPGEDG